MRRGFDEFYGTLGNASYFQPAGFVDSLRSPEARAVADESFYTTSAYAARSVDWLERHKERPWFLYVAFNALHGPLEAPRGYLDRHAAIDDARRRTFAAALSALDDAVGSILSKVRELGQAERTLVWFLSDNGGPTSGTTASNGPLRGGKASTWEGGIRVPFCVRWTGTLPAGATYAQPVLQLDIVPTSLAAAGAALAGPSPIDGVNLLPYLTGERSGRPHPTLYWRFRDHWAIRHGDWKLVAAAGGGPHPELYDLATDSAETRDRTAERPETVRELKALWDRWNAEQAPASPEWRKRKQPRAEGDDPD
jgi:arylsulfatase A-like enzyme